MNFVKPKKLSPERYKSLIDSICAQAHMENMETDPEDRGDISEDIADILRHMIGDDADKVLALYNTMRKDGAYFFRYRGAFRYGYVYFADEDFFNAYYEDCCPSEIVDDIRSEEYDDERFVSVGRRCFLL